MQYAQGKAGEAPDNFFCGKLEACVFPSKLSYPEPLKSRENLCQVKAMVEHEWSHLDVQMVGLVMYVLFF